MYEKNVNSIRDWIPRSEESVGGTPPKIRRFVVMMCSVREIATRSMWRKIKLSGY
jgi:hypothetical protein